MASIVDPPPDNNPTTAHDAYWYDFNDPDGSFIVHRDRGRVPRVGDTVILFETDGDDLLDPAWGVLVKVTGVRPPSDPEDQYYLCDTDFRCCCKGCRPGSATYPASTTMGAQAKVRWLD